MNSPDQVWLSLEFFNSYVNADSPESNQSSKQLLKIFVAELFYAILKASPNVVNASYGQFLILYENSLTSIGDIIGRIQNDERFKIRCITALTELCSLGTWCVICDEDKIQI